MVSDRALEAWLTEQEAAGNAPTTMQRKCDALFHFYVWAQSRNLVKHRIKVPTINDHEDFKPALTTKPARSSSDRKGSKYGVVLRLRPKAPKGERLHIPSSKEVEAIFAKIPELFSATVAMRNTLLVKWYAWCGLRRFEWVHLYLRNLPDREEVDDAVLGGLAINTKLEVTKGGTEQYVDVSGELLEATLEYVEGPRKRIVERFSRRPGYKEPKEVFLSETTGLPLNVRSVSNLLTAIFKAAGAAGTGHRLRATFLDNVTVAETRAEEIQVVESGGLKHAINHHNVALRAAEKARHKQVSSQEAYVKRVRKQRGKAAGHDEIVSVHMELQASRTELAAKKAEVLAAKKELAKVQAELAESRKLKAMAGAPARKRSRIAASSPARRGALGTAGVAEA